MRARLWLAAAALLAGAGALGPSLRVSDAAAVPPAPQRAVEDTVALSRFLGGVRGASPLFCELTTRMVDGRSYWSSGSGGAFIETDSASAAVIRWVHGSHTDARLVPRLAAGLRDQDRCVQRVSGALLGRVKHAAAPAALLAALDDANPGTRAAAAIGLGVGEHRAAVSPLLGLLRDAAPDVRRAAAWALGAIEDKAAMLPLIELLGRDPDARVRAAAAWAIGEVTG